MTITYHPQVEQGSDAWYALRCGLLTASEMSNIITPAKLEAAKDPSHLYELLAQRITKYVEPSYISDDMLRGHEDEIYAKDHYAKNYEPTQNTGFVTNDKWGFTIGYSPDALIGDDGQVECKSHKQEIAMKTIMSGEMPVKFRIQVQTGLLVTERKWCDFVSYCGGLPMKTIRVLPDLAVQAAILTAAQVFENRLKDMLAAYEGMLSAPEHRLIPTVRVPRDVEVTV